MAITHGTDTMEETSYFLNLVVKSDKPVVLTGSMRPSTAMSADGPLNIYNAVAIAADPNARGRGVLVTVDDDIHSGHDIVKTHTTDVGTMSSGEAGLVGATLFGKNTWYRTPAAVHTKKSEFSIDGVSALPRVDIIYAHANMSPDIITVGGAERRQGTGDRGRRRREHDGARRSRRSRRRSPRASWWCGPRGPTAASSAATSS